MARSQSRPSTSGVSARPSAGSRSPYPSPAEVNSRWRKVEAPGGRKLWIRMVTAFSFVALLGLVFIILGSVFAKSAYEFQKSEGMSLPLVWCVVGIVSGCLMFVGSFVLGKLIISSKWRTNQQPVYSDRTSTPSTRVHYRTSLAESEQIEMELPSPPPYEESPYDDSPPFYTVSTLSAGVPSILDDVDSRLASASVATISTNPPSYYEVVETRPPRYSQIDPMLLNMAGSASPANVSGDTSLESSTAVDEGATCATSHRSGSSGQSQTNHSSET